VTKRKKVHGYEISNEFWNKIKPLLPSPKPKKKAGRPREDDRKIMNVIFLSPSDRLPVESIARVLWSSKYCT
jgi:transposase